MLPIDSHSKLDSFAQEWLRLGRCLTQRSVSKVFCSIDFSIEHNTGILDGILDFDLTTAFCRNLHGFLYGFFATFLKISTDQFLIRSKISLFKLQIFSQKKYRQQNTCDHFPPQICLFRNKIRCGRYAQRPAHHQGNINTVNLRHSHADQ